MSYSGHSLVGGYLSSEVQSVQPQPTGQYIFPRAIYRYRICVILFVYVFRKYSLNICRDANLYWKNIKSIMHIIRIDTFFTLYVMYIMIMWNWKLASYRQSMTCVPIPVRVPQVWVALIWLISIHFRIFSNRNFFAGSLKLFQVRQSWWIHTSFSCPLCQRLNITTNILFILNFAQWDSKIHHLTNLFVHSDRFQFTDLDWEICCKIVEYFSWNIATQKNV